MTKEIPANNQAEIYDVKTLSAQNKVRILLRLFELSKDKDGIEKRKQHFLDLLSQYFNCIKLRKVETSQDPLAKQKKDAITSNTERRKIHDQIMDIINKMALSASISPDQRQLVQYLAEDRERVEEMIRGYFSSSNQEITDPERNNILYQARNGGGWFVSVPGKEEE